MGYSDITRLAGNLSSESLQSLRKARGNGNYAKNNQGNFQAELQNAMEKSDGSVVVDIQRSGQSTPVIQSSRIRSPELASGVVQELREQILEHTTEALLAQANFSPQTLMRLQR